MSFSRRGGARVGAGRKKKPDRGVSHAKRPELKGWRPAHVTVRVADDVLNLRTWRCFRVICAAFAAGCDRFGLRVVGIGIQGNHLHLLVEAASAAALARGMKGLEVRLARGLNRLMGRRGAVFPERFHAHVLRTPREVRAAQRYVSRNTVKHASQVGRRLPADYRDPYTVGYFGARTLLPPGTEGMVVEPETWLLAQGWQRGAAPARVESARGPEERRASVARVPNVLALFGAGETYPPGPDSSEHRDRPAGTATPRAA